MGVQAALPRRTRHVPGEQACSAGALTCCLVSALPSWGELFRTNPSPFGLILVSVLMGFLAQKGSDESPSLDTAV